MTYMYLLGPFNFLFTPQFSFYSSLSRSSSLPLSRSLSHTHFLFHKISYYLSLSLSLSLSVTESFPYVSHSLPNVVLLFFLKSLILFLSLIFPLYHSVSLSLSLSLSLFSWLLRHAPRNIIAWNMRQNVNAHLFY